MRRRIEASRSRSGEPPFAPGWRDIAGLGEVLADPAVTDVLIAGPGAIRVERDGLLEQVGHIGTMDLERLIEALLGPNGRRVDRLHPIADVRIDDPLHRAGTRGPPDAPRSGSLEAVEPAAREVIPATCSEIGVT